MPGSKDTTITVDVTKGIAQLDTLIQRLERVSTAARIAEESIGAIGQRRANERQQREEAYQQHEAARLQGIIDREQARTDAEQTRRDARETARDRPGSARRRMLRAFAGGVGYKVMNEIGGRIEAYYGTMGPLTGGLTSGSLYNAMGASIQAHAAREMVTGTPQLLWGAAGAVGGGMMVAGGAGLIGASGTAAVSGPVGWALLAGGVLLSLAARWGTAAANAQIARMSSAQQSAVQVFQRAVEARSGLARVGLSLGAFGMGMPGAEEFKRATQLGFESSDVAQRYQAFAAAGGTKTNVMGVLGMERAYGIDAGTFGRWQRAFQPGAGATMPGGFNVLSTEVLLRNTMAAGLKAGIQEARLGEYLQRISALNEQLVERGVTISAEGVANWQRGLAAAGIKGMMGVAGLSGVANFGAGLGQTVKDLFMPQQLIQAMGLRALALRGGATPKGMMSALETVRRSPEGMLSFAQDMSNILPEDFQTLAMGQVTGYQEWGTMAAARKARPKGASPWTTLFGGAEELARSIYAATPETGLLTQQATSENIITFGAKIGELTKGLEQMSTVSQSAIENLAVLADVFKQLAEDIKSERSRPIDVKMNDIAMAAASW
jgi:hypothetical protein